MVNDGTRLPAHIQTPPPRQQRFRPAALLTALYLGTLLFLLCEHVAQPVSAVNLRSSQNPQAAAEGPSAENGVAGNEQWVLRRLIVPGERLRNQRVKGTGSSSVSPDFGECMLLFGAFCNGNMGDVIQPMAMEHLLASVAPDQCFWYAHPGEEGIDQGDRIGEFFSDNISGDSSRLIHLTPGDAEKVNVFKALIIGGGGIFAAKHAPLDVDAFADRLTLPIVIMGVGASRAKNYATLVEKAVFVSGRDTDSIDALSNLLRKSKGPVVQPEDVALVRDPVLSDKMLTDTKGTCWKQSEGEHEQPLCFILPASNTAPTIEMHKHLLARVVRPGDVFVNVFPKHQEEILEQHDYPGEVLQILDPAEFTQRLCSCRAIVSTRFHGVILGLHMGVPTFGASDMPYGNKVPGVLIDTMRLPEQYLVINEGLTREDLDQEVGIIRGLYASHGRRTSIHARLSELSDDFESHAEHVLFHVLDVEKQESLEKQQQHRAEDFFSDNEITAFLPAASAIAGNTASELRSGSSVLPKNDGSEAAAAIASRAVVVKATSDLAPELETKKEEEKKKMKSEKKPVLTEEVETEAEKKRTAAAISQESLPMIERVGGTTADHAASGTTRIALKPSISRISDVIHRSSAAKPDGHTPATGPKTSTSAKTKEKLVDVTDAKGKEATESVPLAALLLTNSGVFRRSVEDEAEPTIEAKSKTSLPETDKPRASVGTGDPSAAEPPKSSDMIVKKGVVADAQQQKRSRNEGTAVTTIDDDGYHRRREPQRTKRTATTSETSVPDMGSAIDNGAPAAEGVSTNDAIGGVLIDEDYMAATLLLGVVVGLAFLPSGGTARKASHDGPFVGGAVAESGRGTASRAPCDGDSLTSGGSELCVSPTRSAGAASGIAATPSRMLFMLNFAVWVSLAIGFSSYGKAYLRDTRDPVGLLVLQGAVGVMVLCSLGRVGIPDLRAGKALTPSAARHAGLAALLHTGQALLTTFAVLSGGVAMTNGLKAIEPVAAAVFSYFLLGNKCSAPRVVALATIVAGISLLTSKDNNNTGSGSDSDYVLVSAVFTMTAVCFNALRNVVIKKGDPIPPHRTLLACSGAATVVGVGLVLLRSGLLALVDSDLEDGQSINSGRDPGAGWFRMSGVNAGLCFVGYNLASFNLLVRLSPVGHAVGNSCKRMLVFAIGLLFLGEVMTVRQLGGTAVALFGVLAYNIAGIW
ncbi:unnamed protein product [Ectocarpus sp. CCAP 1310/34]|nr:unnamed protein product [Ectocarpus sp. CCAP 1310/34]